MIVAQLQSEESNLAAEDVCLLSVPRSAVICGQVRLACSLVSRAYRVLVLSIHGDADEHYRFTYDEWLRLKLVDGQFRLLRLAHVLRLVVVEQQPQQMIEERPLLTSSQQLTRDVMVVEEEYALSHVTPIWLHEQWTDAPLASVEQVVDYVTLFFDFVMMHQEALVGRVERKWLAYLDRRAAVHGHSRLAFLFLVVYVDVARRAFDSDPLLQQWLAMQLYVFRHTRQDEALFHANLRRHVAYFARHPSVTTHWQHRHWHSLVLPSADDAFWYDEAGLYCVSARWLFEPEFVAAIGGGSGASRAQRPGEVVLSRGLFVHSFLPALYRHVLLDLIGALHHQNSGREYRDWAMQACFYGADPAESDFCERLRPEVSSDRMPHFESTIYSEVLLEYNMAAQAYASPVMRLMPRHLEEKKRRQASAHNGTDAGSRAASLLDIEDLFGVPEQVMPPCLSRVMRQDWCKHTDRRDLVAYLLDMGYTEKADVVGALCRHRADSPFDHATIESLYDEHSKKKQSGKDKRGRALYMGRVSPSCGTIINFVPASGNNIRCLYEERANGESRRTTKHSDTEKAKFTAKCGCTLAPGFKMLSPMDYVGFKVNQLQPTNKLPDDTL